MSRGVRIALQWFGGVLVGLLLVLVGIAECGEVAVLESGATGQHTRIWVVDIDGVAYIRGNSSGSWVGRVRERPEVRLRRGGGWRSYRAVPIESDVERVHRAMRSKYGFSERFRETLRGVESSAVFRLEPSLPRMPSAGGSGR